LLEEFYYSFALSPSTSAVKDVVCLVWASVDSKTVRYVMDNETLKNAEIKANSRREFDNKAKTITQQAVNRFSVKAKKPSVIEKTAPQSDYEILRAAEQLLGNLSDEHAKTRLLSIINAMQDDFDVIEDGLEDESSVL